MFRYNVVPVTNKPKVLVRNLANATGQTATNCLGTWFFFSFISMVIDQLHVYHKLDI